MVELFGWGESNVLSEPIQDPNCPVVGTIYDIGKGSVIITHTNVGRILWDCKGTLTQIDEIREHEIIGDDLLDSRYTEMLDSPNQPFIKILHHGYQ